jgi:uncharacterized protein (UPF0276 family)
VNGSAPRSLAQAARPFLGHGVGLRVPHYGRALEGSLDVDWVEVISENFMRPGGRPLAVLERVRRELPVVLHGVSLAIGSVAPLDRGYLRALRALVDRVEPAWVSDHLSFGRVGAHHAHDLLPLPYTEEALALVVERVLAVQDVLGRPLVLENVSSYVGYLASRMSEWEFLAEVARRADCRLLLDLNNVVVSAANHGFAAEDFVAGLPADRVWQLHLANHDVRPTHRLDSHRGAVPDEVWRLYDATLARLGPVSSLVEWDEEIPTWETLRAEQRKAAARAAAASRPAATSATPAPPAAGTIATRPVTPAPPTSLAATQALFWRLITSPRGVADHVAVHGDDEVERTFLDTPAFDRVARLEVYADAYFWRLLGVAREMFPLTAWLLGRERFHDLVTDYLLVHPSTEPDIGRVGDALPSFVAGHRYAVDGLAEIAAIELADAVALHGADDRPATRAELGAIPAEAWPALHLRAVATARLLPCRLDLDALEASRAAGGSPPVDPAALPGARDGDHILVWRRGHATRRRAVGPAEAAALAGLLTDGGASFAALCASADTPATAAAWLARWVDDGLVAIVTVGVAPGAPLS